ncbi:MAG TPA: ModE family transcriptional regulator [Casimicrobiaceae bacterium]|nr:ModE family transcriptional regulator [Casimicrobiaceae bacterium]
MKPTVRFHIHDDGADCGLAIGPGKIALLEAIHQTGSITSSAKALGMSYRRAWLLLEETNRCLVRPAVHTTAGGEHGGGTSLTPLGLQLVRRYRAVERRARAAVGRDLNPLLRASRAR